MTDASLLFRREGGVATITFNRPARKNAFDFSMLVDLVDMLNEERKHFEDRVLVLTGTGGSFCSGADVSDPAGILGATGNADHPPATATGKAQQAGNDSGEDGSSRRLANSGPAAGTSGTWGETYTRKAADTQEAFDSPTAEGTTITTEDVKPHDLYGLRYLAEAALALHRLPIPTIAKVEGIAAGAGLSLALACDLVVASEGARFSEIFPRRGLSLDGGSSWLLPRLVGLHKAKELAFFGDILSARDALDIGLVNRVVPSDDLDDFVDNWAQRLASGPTLAISMTKTMLNAAFNASFDETVENEIRAQALNFKGYDTLEAMGAFLQRREPHFRGR
ncbi:MAG: enoyl-CoA hydratase-related protein [Actinobacteria bacterium]|nr:enoyl-CoA hydratase-related protein [Actinomycetota bacterium]MCL5446251.1 enoyl-CoA hydratase-related protein [Actinomycetota bacterium]